MVIKQKLLRPINILVLFSISVLACLTYILFSSSTPSIVSAVPTIAITSPTSNQQIAGTNFTVKGTASPNTTVVVSNDGLSFAQTKSDGSGNWSVSSSLPAGEVKITARAIENPNFGYYPSTALDFSSTDINQIDLSNFTINPNPGWPVNTPRFLIGLMPSPLDKIFYTNNPFNPSALPEKFDASNPAEPVPATGTFPANPQTNKGDFNSDGTKYYTGSVSANNVVSVVNVASNAHLTDIDVSDVPVTVWRSPNGKIYAAMNNNKVKIINPETDTVEATVDIPCISAESVNVVSFSQDTNYPYYYVPCMNDGVIKKIKLSDNSVTASFTVGGLPVSSALSLDNKRLFVSNRTGSDDRAKMRVLNTENGSLISTIDLTGGALAFVSTPDFQKIFIATPESLAAPGTFDVQNIDVIDTTTYAKNSIATTGFPTAVTFSPSEIAEADVDVTFVLGATTTTSNTASKLAETGTITIPLVILIGILLSILLYLYLDYRKHKKPLIEVNPKVHYTFVHHVKMVTIPLLKYRLTFSFDKKRNNLIHK